MNSSLFVGIYQEALRAWPNRWLGFSMALMIAAAVALVATVLPDRYQSKAKVYINTAAVLEPLLKGLAVADDGEKRVRLLRVLQTTLVSKDNVERLIKTPGMGFDTSTAASRKRAYDTIVAGVAVSEEAQNLFSFDYVDTDPVRARNVAQGLLQLFIGRDIMDARQELTAAREFLDKQISEYATKLHELERQIADFRVNNADELGSTAFQTRLAAARTAVREARFARQVAVETRTRIEQRMASGPNAKPLLVANEATLPNLVDRMSALQDQLNRLLLQYTDKHPDVVATKREMQQMSEMYGLNDNLASVAKPISQMPGVPPSAAVDSAVPPATIAVAAAAESATVQKAAASAPSAGVSAIKLQLLHANFAIADAERKMQAAEAELSAIQSLAATAPSAETSLDQLNRDYALTKENYEKLLRGRETARMQTAANMAGGTEPFRVVVAPWVPDLPFGPDRRAIMLLGTLFAVVGGGGLAYALGLVRGTFVSASEAESVLGLPVIAQLTNRQGVLSRMSQSADAFALLTAIVGLFVAAYVWSAATQWMSPVRGEIYRLFDSGVGAMISNLF
jgi:uncharacterized protein involved in exopolysaccharide biosynthesis